MANHALFGREPGPFDLPARRTFDHLAPAEQRATAAETARVLRAWLAAKPRTEFPTALEVRYQGKAVAPHVADTAFGYARRERAAAGKPADFDWIAALARHMPLALLQDTHRRQRLESIPVYGSASVNRDEEAAAFPPLKAPLVL